MTYNLTKRPQKKMYLLLSFRIDTVPDLDLIHLPLRIDLDQTESNRNIALRTPTEIEAGKLLTHLDPNPIKKINTNTINKEIVINP
jgi:hypothetical protein